MRKLQITLDLGEDSTVCTTDDEDSGLDTVSEDDFQCLSPQDCDHFQRDSENTYLMNSHLVVYFQQNSIVKLYIRVYVITIGFPCQGKNVNSHNKHLMKLQLLLGLVLLFTHKRKNLHVFQHFLHTLGSQQMPNSDAQNAPDCISEYLKMLVPSALRKGARGPNFSACSYSIYCYCI